MIKFKNQNFKGVKIQQLSALFVTIGCLLAFTIFFLAVQIKSKYETIISSMNDYSECNKAVYELRDASDFLTNQIRLFTVTLDPEYLQNYFYELSVLRRRETALEILEMSHENDTADVNLKLAYSESKYLVNREFYIMKLICSAIDISEEFIPDEIIQVELTAADSLLNNEARIGLAQNSIFDSDYVSAKDRVTFYTNASISALVNDYISKEKTNDASITLSFAHQTLFIFMLFASCVVLYILLVILVYLPLYHNFISIQKNEKMEMKGAFEVRYIAGAYNALRDKNAVTASILKHKAEHDPLTGLINRNAFDQIKTAMMNESEPVAYLLIDIDLFKSINDNYGHPVGDEVLRKISGILKDQFRSSDYVARIGGDEFAVIMTKFGESANNIISRKVKIMNDLLSKIDDESIPPVTLSVGVSVSSTGYNPELVEKADKALYSVKRNGRCNVAFYDEL